MPSRIAATAADMPLSYQNFKNYAEKIADKTAHHALHIFPLPEIWVLTRENSHTPMSLSHNISAGQYMIKMCPRGELQLWLVS